MKIIAQYGFKPHPDLPNVPLFKMPDNEIDRQVLEILYARDETGQALLWTPLVFLTDRLKLLRASFIAMVDGFGVSRRRQRRSTCSINPVHGEELEALAQRLSTHLPGSRQSARARSSN